MKPDNDPIATDKALLATENPFLFLHYGLCLCCCIRKMCLSEALLISTNNITFSLKYYMEAPFYLELCIHKWDYSAIYYNSALTTFFNIVHEIFLFWMLYINNVSNFAKSLPVIAKSTQPSIYLAQITKLLYTILYTIFIPSFGIDRPEQTV